jgi:transposase
LLPELGLYNRAEIACLCGLAPKNKDSGTKTGKRHIHGGRFNVRKALYMPAVSSIIHNPQMREYYDHLKSKGKESKVALVAIMRKLIITLNAMIRDKKDWCSK